MTIDEIRISYIWKSLSSYMKARLSETLSEARKINEGFEALEPYQIYVLMESVCTYGNESKPSPLNTTNVSNVPIVINEKPIGIAMNYSYNVIDCKLWDRFIRTEMIDDKICAFVIPTNKDNNYMLESGSCDLWKKM